MWQGRSVADGCVMYTLATTTRNRLVSTRSELLSTAVGYDLTVDAMRTLHLAPWRRYCPATTLTFSATRLIFSTLKAFNTHIQYT